MGRADSFPDEKWTDGHGDVMISWSGDEWTWMLREEDPAHLKVVLGPESQLIVPDLEGFDFLGAPGSKVWVIPQVSSPGIPFVGINTSGIGAGLFNDNKINLSLTDFEGPGNFFLWSTGSSGNVGLSMNSMDGLSDQDSISSLVPGHSHANWGFSAPGTYALGLTASGNLAESGIATRSQEQIFVFQVSTLDSGEVDIEVVYGNGEWEVVFLDESTESEYPTEDVALHVPSNAWTAVPNDERFEFLGTPGQIIHVLPEDEEEGILFLGIAGDEISAGTFVDDSVRLQLKSIDGPGELSVFSTDSFGAPVVYMNSRDGISGSDFYPVPVGGHAHTNWAFSAPGYYRITFAAEGLPVGGDEISTSADVVFNFEVFSPFQPQSGEVDIELAYEDGGLEFEIIDDETGLVYSPGEVVFNVIPKAVAYLPPSAEWSFLGDSGEFIFILPQSEDPEILFLGLATDEIPADVLMDDSVRMEVVSLDGPGDFALYSVDSFGMPQISVNSADGLAPEFDGLTLSVGQHAHYNWAFTEPGFYQIQIQLSATPIGGDEISSELFTFTFDVKAPVIFSEGEVDIEIAIDDADENSPASLEIVLLHDESGGEYDPSQSVFAADGSALVQVPASDAFRFLGSAEDMVFILPQGEVDGIVFPGLATDEIPSGIFLDEMVNLHLMAVQGPGNFHLYQTDSFGLPTVFMDSADGISDSDVLPLGTGEHSHLNWAFSSPGVYRIYLQASAVRIDDNSEIKSPVIPFIFALGESRESVDSIPLAIRLNSEGIPVLSWMSEAGASYRLLMSTTLDPGSFVPAADPVEGTGSVMELPLSNTLTDNEFQFYILSR